MVGGRDGWQTGWLGSRDGWLAGGIIHGDIKLAHMLFYSGGNLLTHEHILSSISS
jgi:hypothetical protein